MCYGNGRVWGQESECGLQILDYRINHRQQSYVSLALIGVTGVLLYANTLDVPFYLDDLDNIVENSHIRLTELSCQGLADAAFGSLARTRPVANVSFALNYYVHQYHVAGFHEVNIAIHVLTGMLLFLLFKATLATPVLASRYRNTTLIAFFGALLWVAHPLHTQSVTYIVQRMNSMAALFCAISLLLYARGRASGVMRSQVALYSGAAGAGILALGSKQIAATLPFFIVLYEWYFFQGCSWRWVRAHKRILIAAAALTLAIAGILLVLSIKSNVFSLYAYRGFGMVERLLTQGRAVMFYAGLLLFPHPSRLNLDHDFALSRSLIDPATTLLSLTGIVGMLVLAGWLLKRDPLVSFSLCWFLGNLIVESSVLPLELVFEHRTYMPSMFLALSVSALLYRFVKPRWISAALLGGIVLVLCLWTWQRNSVWRDPVTFWQDCVQKSPSKARPHNNLGLELEKRGNLDEAAKHFLAALRIDPDHYEAHGNLGMVYAKQGKRDEALHHFGEALRIEPNYPKGHNNLGRALLDAGRQDQAIAQFKQALEIDPNMVSAHLNLGMVYGNRGDLDQAVSHFSAAIRIDPYHAGAHYNLGLVLARQGRQNEALRHFEEALRIDPSHEKARIHRDRVKD